MSMTKLKLIVMSALVLGGVVTPLVIQHQALVKQREENQALRQQVERMTQVETENDRLPNLVAGANNAQSIGDDQMHELLRLRGEVALFRHDRAGLAKLMEENARLRGSLLAATESGAKTEHLSQEEEAAKQVGIAKMNFTGAWVDAFKKYAAQNQGQMPTAFDQARGFLPQDINSTMDPNQFEIVYSGSLQQIQGSKTYKPPYIIVLRERQAIIGPDGKRHKAYAFADGHSEVRIEPPEGFDEWEKGRIFAGQ